MGMFDDITVEYLTEDGQDLSAYDFQTKSLENLLLRFKIDEEGELLVYERGGTGYVPYRTAPGGRPFHDELRFYTNRDDGKWIEFRAVVREGFVVSIKDVSESVENRWTLLRALQKLRKNETLTDKEATLAADWIDKSWDLARYISDYGMVGTEQTLHIDFQGKAKELFKEVGLEQ